MHGYSLLRTQLNQDYFNAVFDRSLEFDVGIEGHRRSFAVVEFTLRHADMLVLSKIPKPDLGCTRLH